MATKKSTNHRLKPIAEVSLWGIPLLPRICGLDRGEITNNELTSPGMGYTVPYNGPQAKATIYIYDGGLESIPDGPMSDAVRQHFNECIEGVLASVGTGIYSQITKVDSYGTGSPSSGVQFLCCEFSAIERSKQIKTYLYVTACRAKFVKVRYTILAGGGSALEARTFADSVAKLLWPEHEQEKTH